MSKKVVFAIALIGICVVAAVFIGFRTDFTALIIGRSDTPTTSPAPTHHPVAFGGGSPPITQTSNNQYSITATADDHGTVSISTDPSLNTILPQGTNNVKSGQDVTFLVTSEADYGVSNLILDGQDITPEIIANGGSLYTYTLPDVQATHTMQVKFAPHPEPAPAPSADPNATPDPNLVYATHYNLNVVAEDNGKIEPVGAMTASAGETRYFYVTPNEGYVIQRFLLDNKDITSTGVKGANGITYVYTLTNVQQDHGIDVFFAPK